MTPLATADFSDEAFVDFLQPANASGAATIGIAFKNPRRCIIDLSFIFLMRFDPYLSANTQLIFNPSVSDFK